MIFADFRAGLNQLSKEKKKKTSSKYITDCSRIQPAPRSSTVRAIPQSPRIPILGVLEYKEKDEKKKCMREHQTPKFISFDPSPRTKEKSPAPSIPPHPAPIKVIKLKLIKKKPLKKVCFQSVRVTVKEPNKKKKTINLPNDKYN